MLEPRALDGYPVRAQSRTNCRRNVTLDVAPREHCLDAALQESHVRPIDPAGGDANFLPPAPFSRKIRSKWVA